jgi:hypothetical protein
MKLVGPVVPIGDTNEDSKRLENLKKLMELVDQLITDLEKISELKHKHEYSIKKAGQIVHHFLHDKIKIVEDW